MWDGYHFITLISFFKSCHILSIYLSFLFVHNHLDLNNHLADWNEIWHRQMGTVGVGFYIIKIRITGFLPINLHIFNCA